MSLALAQRQENRMKPVEWTQPTDFKKPRGTVLRAQSLVC